MTLLVRLKLNIEQSNQSIFWLQMNMTNKWLRFSVKNLIVCMYQHHYYQRMIIMKNFKRLWSLLSCKTNRFLDYLKIKTRTFRYFNNVDGNRTFEEKYLYSNKL